MMEHQKENEESLDSGIKIALQELERCTRIVTREKENGAHWTSSQKQKSIRLRNALLALEKELPAIRKILSNVQK